MVADSKKYQTVVNLLKLLVADRIEAANSAFGALRSAVTANNLQGLFTAPELTALQNFESDLAALAASNVVAKVNAEFSETHENQQTEIGTDVR